MAAKKTYAVGDKVQLSAAFKNLKPTRYETPQHVAHREDMAERAGTGTVTRVYPSGAVSVEWENGFASALLHPRFVKTAKVLKLIQG